jgi:hypothetical protein
MLVPFLVLGALVSCLGLWLTLKIVCLCALALCLWCLWLVCDRRADSFPRSCARRLAALAFVRTFRRRLAAWGLAVFAFARALGRLLLSATACLLLCALLWCLYPAACSIVPDLKFLVAHYKATYALYIAPLLLRLSAGLIRVLIFIDGESLYWSLMVRWLWTATPDERESLI